MVAHQRQTGGIDVKHRKLETEHCLLHGNQKQNVKAFDRCGGDLSAAFYFIYFSLLFTLLFILLFFYFIFHTFPRHTLFIVPVSTLSLLLHKFP